MELSTPLFIEAVMGEAERPVLDAASEQLCECLNAASGDTWAVQARLRESPEAIDLSARPSIVILSLATEVARENESMAQIEARLRRNISSLLEGGAGSVFLCTVFRFVARATGAHDRYSVPERVERIRRLNLLAAQLSHDMGVGVIDIDRTLAHIGARALGTDYRLAGRIGPEVAAHAVVSAILAVGLDDIVQPAVLERARNFQGNLSDIGAFVNRRLRRGDNEVGSNDRG